MKMSKEVSEYDQQAEAFLKKTNTTFKAEFKEHGLYDPFHDNEPRDIYNITLERQGRSFTFTFGQSVASSGKFIIYAPQGRIRGGSKATTYQNIISEMRKRGYTISLKDIKLNKDYAEPTAYDVLACLHNYEVGSFEDFISEFGYNDRPLKEYPRIRAIYEAVQKEYNMVLALWTEPELEELREIQ